jgi:hypothetical protein
MHKPNDIARMVIATVLRIFGFGVLLILLCFYLITFNTHESTIVGFLLLTALAPVAALIIACKLHPLSSVNKKKQNIAFFATITILVVWAVDPPVNRSYEYFGEKVRYRQRIFNGSFMKMMEISNGFAGNYYTTQQINTNRYMYSLTSDYKENKSQKIKERLEYIVSKDKYYNDRYKELTNAPVEIDTIVKYYESLFEVYYEE